MFYRLSLIFLIFSTPFVFIDGIVLGIPVWAFASLVSTAVFALFAVLAIEKEWFYLKGEKP